jgi:hypothetical protein
MRLPKSSTALPNARVSVSPHHWPASCSLPAQTTLNDRGPGPTGGDHSYSLRRWIWASSTGPHTTVRVIPKVRLGPRSFFPLLLLVACNSNARLIVDPVWPEGEPAIVFVTDEDDEALAPPQLVEGSPFKFAVAAPDRFIVYARTFDALSGRELTGCEPTFGDGLGQPSGAWSSGVVTGGDAIQLAVEDPPHDFSIGLIGCSVGPKSCDVVANPLDPPPANFGLRGVATIDGDDAISGGTNRSPEDGRSLLLRTRGATVEELPPIDGISGTVANLELDGDTIIGAASGVVFRLDLEGRLVATASNAFAVAYLDTGEDGTTILLGSGGELASIAHGSMQIEALDPPDYGPTLPGGDQPTIGVARAGNFVITGPDETVYAFDGAWRELFSGEQIDAVAADDRAFLIVPRRGEAILWDRAANDFRTIGQFSITQRATTALTLRDGRFLIVGQSGRAAYYNGERMCPLPFLTSLNLEDVDVAPDLSTAYAVGEVTPEDTPPAMWRFDLPTD